MPALATGTASTGSTTGQLPADLPPRTYYVLATADAAEAIEESNESNNTSGLGSVRIGPDLLVSNLSFAGTPVPGGTVTITDVTLNSGGGTAGPSTTQYYLSTNLLHDAGDILRGSRSVGALGAGASERGSAAVVLPAGLSARIYYVLAIADGDGTMPEVFESNNVRFGAIRVTIP